MEKPKKCPWYGSARSGMKSAPFQRFCRDCLAAGPGRETSEEAEIAWNRRTLPEDAIREAAREIANIIEDDMREHAPEKAMYMTEDGHNFRIDTLSFIIRRHLEGGE